MLDLLNSLSFPLVHGLFRLCYLIILTLIPGWQCFGLLHSLHHEFIQISLLNVSFHLFLGDLQPPVEFFPIVLVFWMISGSVRGRVFCLFQRVLYVAPVRRLPDVLTGHQNITEFLVHGLVEGNPILQISEEAFHLFFR